MLDINKKRLDINKARTERTRVESRLKTNDTRLRTATVKLDERTRSGAGEAEITRLAANLERLQDKRRGLLDHFVD